MTNYPLIGGSIGAVVLMVLASMNNIVGYQTVQSSNQKIMNVEISEKDLLFQTIVDAANSKDVQRVIFGSQFTGKRLIDSGMKSSAFKVPVITKRFLNGIYTLGVILFRALDASKIRTFMNHHPSMNKGSQEKLSVVIEKDDKLKSEMMRLSGLSCDCDDGNSIVWHYPVICIILGILAFIFGCLGAGAPYGISPWNLLLMICVSFAENLRCSWT